MGYSIIFLDADGTLFDFDKAEQRAFARTMSAHGLPAGEAEYALYQSVNRELWSLLEQGEVTQEALKALRFERTFRLLGLPALDFAAFNRAYLDALGEGCDLLPGALELCAALKKAGRLLCLATNGVASTQRRRLEGSPLRGMMDHVFISQELGFHKPDPGFFREAFLRLGGPDPSDIILLGDSVTSDMQGGANAGISTCWYNPGGLPCPRPQACAFQIRRLADFLPIAL